ncbi:MAG: molybdopterin-dependent oxidoreductase, partial [Anaerolineae bacterium]
MTDIKSSEITPEHVYLNRRRFMKGAGALALTGLAVAACGPATSPAVPSVASPAAPAGTSPTAAATATPAEAAQEPKEYTDELGDPANTYDAITNFNNYYEFTTDKEGVAKLATGYTTEPWTVQVGGLVSNPKTYGVEDILSVFDQEERIYRLRCVEGWSMVIPWLGFPLAKLLQEVRPTSEAKYVRFQSVFDPDHMPGQKSRWYNWP